MPTQGNARPADWKGLCEQVRLAYPEVRASIDAHAAELEKKSFDELERELAALGEITVLES